MKENTTRPGQFGAMAHRNMVPYIAMVLALCAVSFYLGGAYYGIPAENADGSVVVDRTGCVPLMKVEPFPECNLTTQDMTPCTDPKAS